MAMPPTRVALLLLATFVAVPAAGCKTGRKREKSELARWVDNPSAGTQTGPVIKIPTLGVTFEIPDTLYVYKSCSEDSHSPDGSQPDWIPVISCTTVGGAEFSAFGDAEDGGDPFADESEEGRAEELAVKFYVTHKTRPLDERAVSWFENQYRQAGLQVEELSYQSDFQKKEGIYAKLLVVDDAGNPSREIVQFLFPRRDVVFIARMEYPFGETRSVDQDWKYILWNFEFDEAATAAGEPPQTEELPER